VRLAQALLRVQRVNNDPGAVVIAEHRLRRFIADHAENYDVQRVLGAVLLSQHRFRDALREAQRARAMAPDDWWNYGVLGDAHLELGDYDAAFAAFDRMGALRPGPPAYARVAYALELKGDLVGALATLQMAADGTSGHDAEGQAWYDVQLGHLLLQLHRIGDAKRHYERAALTFPDHPYAMAGLARIKIAEGNLTAALAMYERLHRRAATPETAFIIGDLNARLQEPARAEAMYVEGERLEREGWATEEAQPQALARFLAERNRNIPEAVRLAEHAAATRRDIHTMDALAWAYFKAGRLDEASRAVASALVTGTRDARILHHAAAIHEKLGEVEHARSLRQRAASPLPELTLLDLGTK
jgi:tetratricopeptide (TPR) repeat protein